MKRGSLPSDARTGESPPNLEDAKRLELENKYLALRIEVYEEVLDFYGHLKEAHISLSHRMRAGRGE